MTANLRIYCHSHVVAVVAIILGGSWAVGSEVVSPLIWVITIVAVLISAIITTHEPPSSRGVC